MRVANIPWRVLLVLVLLVGAFSCTKVDEQAASFGTEKIALSGGDRDAIVAAVRQCLETGSLPTDKLGAEVTKPFSKDVFLTLFGPRVESIRFHAGEGSVAASLTTLCREVRAHPAFPSRFQRQMDKTRIAVHVIGQVKELRKRDINDIARRVEPGIHGLVLEVEGKRYYQLGEDVLFEGWGMRGFGDRDRVAGKKLLGKRLDELARQARANRSIWRDERRSKLYFFGTHAMVERKPGGKAFSSYRAFKLPPKEITRADLLEAAWMAGRNLARNTDEAGRLGYHYRPAVDKFSRGYNIVRHAGAVWGLFQAYAATGDTFILDAARRSLAFLEPNIKVAAEDEKVAYLDYQGQSYLGSNALTALSLVEIPQALLTPEWKDRREKLGNSLIAFQVEDGRFYKTWKQVLAKGPVPDPQPMYFPGEAFLALVMLNEADPQAKWLDAAKLCATAQMRSWDANPKQQPDAWVVQAMSRLYRVTKDPKLAEYVFAMVKWHFDHEWGMPEKKSGQLPYKDYFGGADNSTPPRSTPTSARNEADIEAWHLARMVGDAEMTKRLGDAVLASYWHNLIDQFTKETAYFLPRPERAIGGIRGSLITNDIRIDYNQHFLSSAINGLELAEERYGAGEFSGRAKGMILDVAKLGITPEAAAEQLKTAPPAEEKPE